MKKTKPILLVGAGLMAVDYAKVLLSLGKEIVVVGRGKKSAENFKDQTNLTPILGGLDNYLKTNKKLPATAIVAVSEENLGVATHQLLNANFKSILVEKPGGLGFEDIRKVAQLAKLKKSKVYVGYNRRFYTSVQKAQEIIKKDGGVLSFFFDFTEASFRIEPLVRAPGVKEDWFLQNSTHVIDMAFFLGGSPKKIYPLKAGKLSWHKKGAIFVGSGKTIDGALFSYISNWTSPGRWTVEIMTKKHKLIFKPLEKLQIQESGTFAVTEFPLDDTLDTLFKPGIYKQVQSFLGDRQSLRSNDLKKNLCTIEEQVKNLKHYQQILQGLR